VKRSILLLMLVLSGLFGCKSRNKEAIESAKLPTAAGGSALASSGLGTPPAEEPAKISAELEHLGANGEIHPGTLKKMGILTRQQMKIPAIPPAVKVPELEKVEPPLQRPQPSGSSGRSWWSRILGS